MSENRHRTIVFLVVFAILGIFNWGPIDGAQAGLDLNQIPLDNPDSSSEMITVSELVDLDGGLTFPAGQYESIDMTGLETVTSQSIEPSHFLQNIPESPTASSDGTWVEGYYHSNAPNSRVMAMAFDDSGNLYIGGEFTTIGNHLVNYIAMWDKDKKAWYPLGSGIDGYWVQALVFNEDGKLYVGGNFEGAGTCSSNDGCNNIAMWDPVTQKWSSLGKGMNNSVHALAFDGGSIYAGGYFTEAGDCTSAMGCNYIARWDESPEQWRSLESGMDDAVNALAVDSKGYLYAGGEFSKAGTCDSASGCNHIAKWEPAFSKWHALKTGTNGTVRAVSVDSDDKLYVGGFFSFAGNCNITTGCQNIAQWNLGDNTWYPLGKGVTDGVWAIAPGPGGEIFAGGWFQEAGSCDSSKGCNYIARWNPSDGWRSLGTGAGFDVFSIGINGNGHVFAGGGFLSAGNCKYQDGCIYLAKWDTSSGKWSAVKSGFGLGTNHPVLDLIYVNSEELYAGGEFIAAGDCSSGKGCNFIAKMDLVTRKWAPLGKGMNAYVKALAMDDKGNIYAGGNFDSAGDCDSADGCNHIAMWDKTVKKWLPLNSGVEGSVETLYFDSKKGFLYAGGYFYSAGDCDELDGCSYIGRWDPTMKKWYPMGTGMDGPVLTLTVGKDGGVYAGGYFELAGDCDSAEGCNNIAKWDGNEWKPLKSGMENDVKTLVTGSNGEIYAGGDFDSAGNCSKTEGCTGVARWDPSKNKWFPLGKGIIGTVLTLAWGGDDYLFAGGYFAPDRGCVSVEGCNYIAVWDARKSEWFTLGSGMNDYVYALNTDNHYRLFTGGIFTTAGKTVSNNIALWLYGLDNKAYLPVLVKR